MSGKTGANKQPLDRNFSLLETVVSAGRAVSITETAAQLGLPVATVHRIVAQLLSRGLLKRALDSKRVLPGPRLVDFGAAVLECAMVADRPRVILSGLAAQLGESCQIGIVADGNVLYVETATASAAIEGLQFQPGRRAPLHCTSIGKLFLSTLSTAAFEDWLAISVLKRFTPNTIVDPETLKSEIARVRKQGWSSTHSEFVDGVVGCAVPVLNNRKRFIAGLAIAAPAVRFSSKTIKEVIPPLQTAAGAVTDALA